MQTTAMLPTTPAKSGALTKNPLRVLDSKREHDAAAIAGAPQIGEFYSAPGNADDDGNNRDADQDQQDPLFGRRLAVRRRIRLFGCGGRF